MKEIICSVLVQRYIWQCWQHFVYGVICIMRHAYLGNGLKKVGNHWPISICWWANFFQQKRQQRQWSAKESTDFTAYLESDKNEEAKQLWTTSWSCMVLVPESHWKMLSRTSQANSISAVLPQHNRNPSATIWTSEWIEIRYRGLCNRTNTETLHYWEVWEVRLENNEDHCRHHDSVAIPGKNPNTIPRDPHYFLIITGVYRNGALGQFRLSTLSW